MLDYQRHFHIGIRVPSLEGAMAELGAALGITWCSVQQREQQVWLPEQGLATLRLRFTYSAEGPQHVELLEGSPGSLWDGNDRTGIHHQGVWVDDVAAETRRLMEAGWTLELAQAAPDDGFGHFSYVRSPDGVLIEPVSAAVAPMFERWWAGGDLA
jgi:Glyoxalase/Bleomycin resistance protein/Dioxygenase superfamily